ncbi:MAG: thiamine phosphate synthase [Actinomycetota bacterium]|nr:thiamine phosphate synthase [Actinomycetota bacterium]
MRRPVDYSLYLITDRHQCAARGLVSTVAAAVDGGVTAVQLRDPQAKGRELCELATALVELLTPYDVALFVDDRLDVALAAGCDGVHLGQDDLPVTAARALAGPDLVIGWSVTNLAEAAAAARLPEGCIDYLGVGPVFPTGSKADAAAPMGTTALAQVVVGSGLPCVAIGGIGPENLDSVLATGVEGVAVISAICSDRDPEAAARRLAGRIAGHASS